jgi:uncharacterized repeat protein (TIGR03803 family)
MRPFETRLRALSVALAFTIVFLSALAAAPAAKAQTYKDLYNFTGGSDGGYPAYVTLVRDKAGNLYGTTNSGGANGYGTVFKVTESGTETVLYSFTGGADGAYPDDGLVLSGNTLYGSAPLGGSDGYGVVFEVDIKTGAETVLYTFTGKSDGANPTAGLVRDKKGNLYGTTPSGGAHTLYGTVFEVVPKTKTETVLHSFDDSDGAYPDFLTLSTTEKALFGTANGGGSSGYGVVFSLTIKSGAYNVLHNFTGSSDGQYPYGTLALDPNGNLYGTTYEGGASSYGTVFEVVPKTKKETVVYSFTGGADGGRPYGGVIRDKNGKLYGTASEGGANDDGTVFELVKGTETVLDSFDGSDGAYPFCGLIQDSKGDFYGTANGGGSGGYGVVWEITP